MTSAPLDCTHGQHHRAMHDIATFGRHTRSDDVGRGMQSSPLGSTHCRTTSDLACHYSPWTANNVLRRQAWHAIISFGQHKRSNDVGCCMTSYPLDGKHCQTTSGVTWYHHYWPAHIVERRRAWHVIIALGRQTPSNDVRRGMPSSPCGSINDQTMSGVA